MATPVLTRTEIARFEVYRNSASHIRRFVPPKPVGESIQHGQCKSDYFQFSDGESQRYSTDTLDNEPGSL